MPLGAPYTACASSAAGGSATFQVTVTTSTTMGDAIVVALSSNATASAPTGVTDSQGNNYTQAAVDTTRNPNLGIYVALNCTALASGTDWIKGAFAGTGAVKALIARGCSGVVTSAAVDQAVIAHDIVNSTSPSSGATGTLALAAEWAVAGLSSGASGGTPSSWTGGFTAVTTQGAGPYLTLADQVTAATTALTAGATIVSSTWTCAVVTLKGIRVLTSTLPVTVTATGAVTRQDAKALTVSVTATATVQDQVSKTLPVTVTTGGALARTVAKTLTVTAATAGTLVRNPGKTFAAAVTTASSLARSIGKTLRATVSAIASLLLKAPVQPAIITITSGAPLAAQVAIASGIAAAVAITPGGNAAVRVTATSRTGGRGGVVLHP